jgi:hypothetical protein
MDPSQSLQLHSQHSSVEFQPFQARRMTGRLASQQLHTIEKNLNLLKSNPKTAACADQIFQQYNKDYSAFKAFFKGIWESLRSKISTSYVITPRYADIKKLYEKVSIDLKFLPHTIHETLPSKLSDKQQALELLQAETQVEDIEQIVEDVFASVVDSNQSASLLHAVKTIKVHEKTDVLKSVLPLMQNVSNGHRRAFLINATKLGPNEQAQKFALKAAQFFSDQPAEGLIEALQNIFENLNGMQRVELLKELVAFDKQYPSLIFQVIFTLKEKIAPEMRLKAFEMCQKNPSLVQKGVVGTASNLFLHDEMLMKTSYDYLLNKHKHYERGSRESKASALEMIEQANSDAALRRQILIGLKTVPKADQAVACHSLNPAYYTGKLDDNPWKFKELTDPFADMLSYLQPGIVYDYIADLHKDDNSYLSVSLTLFPKKLRASVFKDLVGLPKEKAPVLSKVLGLFPQHERANQLQFALNSTTHLGNNALVLLDVLSLFPTMDRKRLFTDITPKLNSFSADKLAVITNYLKLFLENQRDALRLTQAIHFAENNSDVSPAIFSVLELFPTKKRSDLFKDIFTQLNPVHERHYHDDAVLLLSSALKLLPENKREAQIIPFLQLIEAYNEDVIELFSPVFEIMGQSDDVEGIKQLLVKLQPVDSSSDLRQLKELLDLLPQAERIQHMEALLTVINELPADKIQEFRKALKLVSAEKRSAQFVSIKNTVDNLKESVNWRYILTDLRLFPEELRLSILDRLNASNELDNIDINHYGDIVRYLYENDEQLKTQSLNFIKEQFDKFAQKENAATLTEAESQEAFALAKDVLIKHDRFPLLDDSDPVLMQAMRYFTQFNPSPDQDSTSNPYILYTHLKEISKTEDLVAYSEPVATTLALNDDAAVEKSLALNLTGFRTRAAQNTYYFADLPKGIASDSFEKLFEGLESRLQQLPEEAQQKMNAEIGDLCFTGEATDQPLQVLKAAALGTGNVSGGYAKQIPKLLQIKGEPDQVVSNSVFYLHSILRAIKDESNERAPDALLSAQEQMALKFLSMVRECEMGQKDGIAMYYNLLPEKYRRGSAELGAVEKVEKQIDQMMQNLLNNTLANEELYTEITESQPSQQTHQTLYLKNRFAHQLGLVHALEFDKYPSAIHSGLTKCTEKIDLENETEAQDTLNQILKHISPQKLIALIKQHLSESARKAQASTLEIEELKAQILKNKKMGKNVEEEQAKLEQLKQMRKAENLISSDDLTVFLEQAKEINEELQDYMILNEDSYEFESLTDQAAYKILLKMGYISSIEAPLSVSLEAPLSVSLLDA